MEWAVNAGAEDIAMEEDGIEVVTLPEDFHAIQSELVEHGLIAEDASIVQRASSEVTLDDKNGEKVLKLLDALEELDDVQDVYSNANFPDSLLSEAG